MVLGEIRTELAAQTPKRAADVKALERDLANARVEQKRLAKAVALADDVEELASELRKRSQTIASLESQITDFIDNKLSIANQHGPMAMIVRELAAIKTAIEVRDSLEAQGTSMLSKSAGKGEVFENELENALARLAAQHGDTVERVSRAAGAGRCKRGDFIYEIPKLDARIVIEARDGQINSLPRLRREMKEALTNRTADTALTIVRDVDELPEQVGRLAEYPEGVVGTYADLEIVLKLVRGRLAAQRTGVESVDVEELTKGLAAVRTAMRREAAIRREVKIIVKATSCIEGELRDLRQEIDDGATMIASAME